MSAIRLDGRIALVTGASSGLGARFAQVLAGAGAEVVLAARRIDRLEALATTLSASGGKARTLALDVTDTTAVRAAVDGLGPLHILVNNSGISTQARIVDVEPDDYDRVMATNLRAAFFVAQAAARSMIAHKIEGRIVNIASVAGLKPLGQIAVYSMSKAGVVHMTRAFAIELSRHGINTNAICPGYIETEINADYWLTEGGRRLMERLPRKRVGRPEDLDGLVLLLSSDEARFINGAIIAADDGIAAA